MIPHLVSIATAEVLNENTGCNVAIRWPNDLYSDGKKIAGVLLEGSFHGSAPDLVVAGIGVNLNQQVTDFPPSLQSKAGSLRDHGLDLRDTAVQIICRIEIWWNSVERERILNRWSELSEGEFGYSIRVDTHDGTSFKAITNGLAGDGGLNVEIEGGEKRVLYAEDVLYLREVSSLAEENYYSEVETYFIGLRGSPLFITPAEWAIVANWEASGIPLKVVKEGIDRVFERPRKPSSTLKLGYCKQAVAFAFRRFREIKLGNRNRDSEEKGFDVKAHLVKLVSEVREKYPKLVNELDLLAESGLSLSEMEEALMKLNDVIIDKAESEADETLRAQLLSEAEASLSSYRDKMSVKVYQLAIKSGYRRRLRQRLKLPFLSLLHR